MRGHISWMLCLICVGGLEAQSKKVVRYYDVEKRVPMARYSVSVSDTSLRHGIYERYDTLGRVEVRGAFWQGLRDGLFVHYYSGRRVLFVNYERGVKEGLSQAFFDDGSLKSSSTYLGDVLWGEAVSYYANGRKRNEAHFVSGLPQGDMLSYYEEGQLKMRVPMDTGLRHGVLERYYANGILAAQEPYLRNRLEGKVRYYYEDGSLREEGFFHRGVRDKTLRRYYRNGVLSYEAHFVDQTPVGDIFRYDSTGRCIERTFDSGRNMRRRERYGSHGELWQAYVFNKLETEQTYFRYDEGRLITKRMFCEGVPCGTWERYDSVCDYYIKTAYRRGKVRFKRIYHQGDLICTMKASSKGGFLSSKGKGCTHCPHL